MSRRLLSIAVMALLLAGLGSLPLHAQPKNLPELHFEQIWLDPAVPVEHGKPLTIKADIVNTGQQDAGPFSVKFSWRQDGGEWTTFFTKEVAGLPSGKRVLFERENAISLNTAQLPIPTTPSAQLSFGLRMVIDPHDNVAEQDENNNEAITSFSVFGSRTAGKADLRPLDLSFATASVSPTATVSVTDEVLFISSNLRNTGEVTATPFNVTISYCATPLSPLAVQMGLACPDTFETVVSKRIDVLEPGAMDTVSGELRVRERQLEAGIYEVRVRVDSGTTQLPDGEVAEQDEDNNTLSAFLTVHGPELRPVGITLGSNLVTFGATVDLSAEVRNNGSSSVRPGSYDVAFLVNGVLLDKVPGPGIDPGGTQPVVAGKPLNTSDPKFNLAAGARANIRVVVDVDNDIAEPDESNNAMETSLTLLQGLPNRAELHPKDIVLDPPSPIVQRQNAEDRLTVKATIINSGTQAAAGFTVELAFREKGTMGKTPLTCSVRGQQPDTGCRNLRLAPGDDGLTVEGVLLVDDLPTGTPFEVLVEVDPPAREGDFGQVPELDEANNVLSTTFTLSRPQLPDLVVTGFSTTPTNLSLPLRRGQFLQIQAEVRNGGEVDVTQPFAVVCRLIPQTAVLNPNGTISQNALAERDCPGQGRAAVGGLAKNQRTTVAFELDTTGLPPGFYQIAIEADPADAVNPNGAISELDEFNNRTLGNLTTGQNIFQLSGPDLTVSLVGQSLPAAIFQGEPLNVRVLVNNVGTENAPRFAIALTIDCPGAPRESLTQELPGLGAQDPLGVTVDFSFGNTQRLPIGPCSLNVTVDPNDRVQEANEFNNSLLSTFGLLQFTVERPLAQLKPLSITFSPGTRVNPGEALLFKTTVGNFGGRPSGPFTVLFSLCLLNNTGTTQGAGCQSATDFKPVGSEQVTNLEPGQSLEVVTLINSGAFSLASGSYLARVEVDVAHEVPESDEFDNVLTTEPPLVVGNGVASNSTGGSGSGTVGGQSEADLVIANFDLTKNLIPRGLRVNFTFAVLNQGVQDAGPFTVKAFYKAPGDREVEFQSWRVNGVAQKTGLALDASLDTSGLSPANYKIIIVVDTFNEVEEAFEANNRQERWLQIV